MTITPLTEFELITRYFQSHPNKRNDIILGIGDDCALLKPPTDQHLAVTTDTLTEGVHFLPHTSAKTLGHKSLAVSLSDLAAMGAEPAWVVLSLSLPNINETWLSEFCVGFFHLLDNFNLQLVGGNITRGELSITTCATGFIPPGKALRRDTAKPGDIIYLTGCIGDAALALNCLQGKIDLPKNIVDIIRMRLETPTPCISAGLALRNIATAAIDISDGLLADLGHILEQSKVGATIDLQELPLSKTLRDLPQKTVLKLALTGGDDYELCFTVPPAKVALLEKTFLDLKMDYWKIGVIDSECGLRFNGEMGFDLTQKGYRHF